MVKRKFFPEQDDDKETKNTTDNNEPQTGTGDSQPGFETTVLCPHHELPLEVETENYFDESTNKTAIRRFAVCRCKVEGNPHIGKRVWEQT